MCLVVGWMRMRRKLASFIITDGREERTRGKKGTHQRRRDGGGGGKVCSRVLREERERLYPRAVAPGDSIKKRLHQTMTAKKKKKSCRCSEDDDAQKGEGVHCVYSEGGERERKMKKLEFLPLCVCTQ